MKTDPVLIIGECIGRILYIRNDFSLLSLNCVKDTSPLHEPAPSPPPPRPQPYTHNPASPNSVFRPREGEMFP